jgi:ketosteroid isomerase-like protein
VRAFIKASNARDFAAVEKLLADDFRLIDMGGAELSGMEPYVEFIRRVAEFVPDYHIHVSGIVERGDDILISGKATSDNPDVGVAMQWRARARGGKLQEWQSYGMKRAPSMMTQFMSCCPRS